MSEYIRTTQECSVSQLYPDLLQAIQNYFQDHELGDLEAESLLCCQTVSKKKRTDKTASWLSGRPDTTIYSGMLLTSQWLIWVQYGDKSGTRLNAARLDRIRTQFYTSTLMQDAGLEIVGYIGDSNTRVRGYIAMGKDQAAQKFCEEVKQATLQKNPPAQGKGWLKWLGGDR